MKEVVLIGTYNFVNFILCKSFLEEGLSVKGLHLLNSELDKVIDEKRLEIGRNANFTEIKQTNYKSLIKSLDENDALVVSIYDYYMKENDEQLFELLEMIEELSVNDEAKLIIILPSKIINNLNSASSRKINELLNKLLDRYSSKSDNLKLIYLPTVYGPWQSENFLFHKILRNKEADQLTVSERESTIDSLYIDDVASEISSVLLGQFENIPQFIVYKSDIENSWHLCLDNINEERLEIVHDHNLEVSIPFEKTVLQRISSLKDGVESQKRFFKRFYEELQD